MVEEYPLLIPGTFQNASRTRIQSVYLIKCNRRDFIFGFNKVDGFKEKLKDPAFFCFGNKLGKCFYA